MAKRDNTKKSVGKQTSKARARKTSAASTAKKRTTKTAAAKKSSTAKKKTTTNKKATNQSASRIKSLTKKLHGLRGLYLLAAAIFAALIVLIYTIMEAIERTAVISYAATDALRDGVLAPAIQNVFTLDLRHALAAGLSVGIIYSVYVATKGWTNYLKQAEKGAVKSRWIFATILGVIGLETALLLVGVFDITLIKLLAAILVGASYLAFKADVESDKKRKGSLFLGAVVAGVLVVLAATVFIAVSMLYGVTLPISHYLAVDFLALGLLAYAVNQLFSFKKRKGFAKPEETERNYVLITTLTAVLFTSTLIVAFIA